MQDWFSTGAIDEDYVYTEIKHWCEKISDGQLSARNINVILERIFKEARLDGSGYSSHSSRRGLVNYTDDQGGRMEYAVHIVGWKDFRSVPTYQAFNSQRLKQLNQLGHQAHRRRKDPAGNTQLADAGPATGELPELIPSSGMK
ncbi:site-specific integrase [Microbulbifer sp. 2201CG32-9]|uniref:hypothetical protein n=1 Tax=Microbulbifer sp. 2201CG32-9 TaxID=3232309 RepID=UPI00345C3539